MRFQGARFQRARFGILPDDFPRHPRQDAGECTQDGRAPSRIQTNQPKWENGHGGLSLKLSAARPGYFRGILPPASPAEHQFGFGRKARKPFSTQPATEKTG